MKRLEVAAAPRTALIPLCILGRDRRRHRRGEGPVERTQYWGEAVTAGNAWGHQKLEKARDKCPQEPLDGLWP